MSVMGILLLSSLCWSLFDVARKNIALRYGVLEALFWITLLQTPIYIYLAFSKEVSFLVPEYLWAGLIGISLNFFANSLFILSIRLAPISETVPLLSLTPVFSALVATVFLGETLTPVKWLGIVIIILGAFLLNGLPSFKNKKGPMLMILVAFFWGAMVVVDKYSLAWVDPSVHLFYQCSGIALLCFVVVLSKKGTLRVARKDWKFFLFATLSSYGAMYTQILAFKSIYVSLAEAIKRALNLVITLIFGKVFFKESIGTRKIVAVLVMALGIYALMK